MAKTLLVLVAVFGVALLLVGLTFSSTAEDRADYVFVNGTEPKTLDPQIMTGQPEGRIADAIFEGLTYREVSTLKPVPGMAKSWEVSPDGTRWTFHLRPGVVWSNGDPVTANDFVYAWRRLEDPQNACEYAYLIHMVRHAEAFNTYESQAKALLGDPDGEDAAAKAGIVAAWRDRLGRAEGGGVSAAEWQAFVDEKDLRSQLTKVSDPVLLDALAKSAGTLSAAEASGVADALAAEGARRRAAFERARDHFGVDEGVFAPDASTFVVELNAYTPYFLELTAFYVLYPVHRPTVERWPHDWFREGRIVSNGPFLLESWRVNEKIRMRKNPAYWGASQVSLRTVDALPIDNRTTSLNLYLTGAADWLPTAYPPDLIDTLKSRDDFYGSPGMVVYFYRINCSKKPFDDPRVRKALAKTVDRRTIVETLTRKGEIPTTSIVAQGIPGYEPPDNDLAWDPDGARRLLAEAGYPEGRGFPSFAIVHNTDEGHKKIAEFVANTWARELHITVSAQNKEWQALLEDVRRLNYDVERAGWIGDYRDPNTFLDMWLTKGGNNQTGWGDPAYDRLIQLAADPVGFAKRSPEQNEAVLARLRERPKASALIAAVRDATDDAARLAAAAKLRLHLFREAEAILLQDAVPVIPFYFYFVSGLVSPRVDGFYAEVLEDGKRIPNLQDLHPFRDVRILAPGETPRAR
jgi:oligopeptide transport system substrate-binding protein